MKQDNLDKLKALRRFAESAKTFWPRYRKAISNPSCDKHQARFNGDDRFTVFLLKNLRFCALTGYFGNSGCSTFGGMDSGLAEKYLPEAMTALAPQLFEKMAELAEADAAKLNADAQKELEGLRALVADATGAECS